jgi:hypothetical protein
LRVNTVEESDRAQRSDGIVMVLFETFQERQIERVGDS